MRSSTSTTTATNGPGDAHVAAPLRTALALLAALVPLLAVGCGGTGGGEGGASGAAGAQRAERAFLSAMVPHHRSALEMAKAAKGRLEHARIRELRTAILETQAAEIAQMRRIHERLFGTPLRPDERAHAQLGLSAEEAGMDHMDAAEPLRRARAPVDRAFIDAMVPHHRGAVAMAEAVLRRTKDRELRGLAEEIIEAQRKEIETMNRVRQREFGGPAPEREDAGEHAPGHAE